MCDGAGVLGSETGWKDAVIAYPNVDDEGEPKEDAGVPIGFSTFIKMKFDILGIYGGLWCISFSLVIH